MDAIIDTAKVTRNGQVTIPVDFRKLLNIKPGNKVLFAQRENGEVVIENASVSALRKAQSAFSGAASDFGYRTEDDVTADFMQGRYESTQ